MKIRLFLFAILCLTLTAFTLKRSFNYHAPQKTEPPTEVLPEGINHCIDNSNSELQEMQQFEKIVNRFLEQWEINGASIAIMKNGCLLYAKGFGWADKEQGIRTDVRHIFRIASLSKLITATGVMKLCEQGKLSLSATVFGPEGILCDSVFSNIRDPRVKKITVEHLLRHQGGFSIRAGDPLFCSSSVARQLGSSLPLTLDDMVCYAAQSRLRTLPGDSYIYSNLGYVILSRVIEKVSGQPYEQYIRNNILNPIGCYDMHIGYSSYQQRFPNEVRYYEPDDVEPIECFDGSGTLVPRCYGACNIQVMSGAGGWVASPTELLKLITAIDPANPKPNILKPETSAYMTSTEQSKYPIGWMKTTENDDWSRTGSLSGSSALLKRQHDGYTWVFITNTSSWSGAHFPAKIAAMMKRAMNKVSKWPDRDLFPPVNPSVDSLSVASTRRPYSETSSGTISNSTKNL